MFIKEADLSQRAEGGGVGTLKPPQPTGLVWVTQLYPLAPEEDQAHLCFYSPFHPLLLLGNSSASGSTGTLST